MIAEDIRIIINFRNETVRNAVAGELENMGFRNVREIDDGIRAGGSAACDLLITDMNLQMASSVNLVMMLKNNVYPERLPVILTAHESEREYYLYSLNTGLVDEFLLYPFTSASLKKRIFRCIFKTAVERMGILIVDDAAPMRNSIRFSLQQIGFRDIDAAVSGEDALTAMKSRNYDLVITDLNMPKMSGIELVENMKKDETLCRIPVLVMTAENEKQRVLSFIKAGVSGYILKPYTMETLQEKIMGLSSYLL